LIWIRTPAARPGTIGSLLVFGGMAEVLKDGWHPAAFFPPHLGRHPESRRPLTAAG
jgi:hypothetical protein